MSEFRQFLYHHRYFFCICVASCLAILAVSLITKKQYYFLIFNLFLAIVPLFFLCMITVTKKYAGTKWWLLPAFLFLPNSFYVWTDIVHPLRMQQYSCEKGWITNGFYTHCSGYLERFIVEPTWVGDLSQFAVLGITLVTIFLSFAAGGLAWLWGLQFVPLPYRSLATTATIVLGAFAINLGRFARTNSWYIITEPFRVLDDVWWTITNTATNLLYLQTFVCSVIFISFSLYLTSLLAPKKI